MSCIWKYTLQKFWRYNKVYLRELAPLEILGDHYTYTVKCARVWLNGEVARFTLLYRQNFGKVYRRVDCLCWRQRMWGTFHWPKGRTFKQKMVWYRLGPMKDILRSLKVWRWAFILTKSAPDPLYFQEVEWKNSSIIAFCIVIFICFPPNFTLLTSKYQSSFKMFLKKHQEDRVRQNITGWIRNDTMQVTF